MLPPNTHTRTYVWISGTRNISFSENFAYLLNWWSHIQINPNHTHVPPLPQCFPGFCSLRCRVPEISQKRQIDSEIGSKLLWTVPAFIYRAQILQWFTSTDMSPSTFKIIQDKRDNKLNFACAVLFSAFIKNISGKVGNHDFCLGTYIVLRHVFHKIIY